MGQDRRIGGAGGGSDPGSGGGKGGRFVAAAVLAGAVAAAGGGLGGGAALGGASSAGGAVDSAVGQNISAKKAEGKKAARKGQADEAWRRMGMRSLKKTVKRDLECVADSFGQVREFFVRAPCTSLDRMLFGIGDGNGNVVVVSVAWVGFRTSGHAQEFKRLDDAYGSGNITPLAGALLDMADIHFTGQHYRSRTDGKTIVIAEAEPGAGHLSDELLDAVADVAAELPRP
jgi:hypothetical protein